MYPGCLHLLVGGDFTGGRQAAQLALPVVDIALQLVILGLELRRWIYGGGRVLPGLVAR